MKKKFIIFLLLFLSSFFVIYSKKNPVNKEITSNSIVIYPFYYVQSDFPEKYIYLKNTIPDILKQEIIDKGIYYLVEKNELEETRAKLKLDESFYKDELSRLKIAKEVKADYFCWGYFIFENNDIIVYFHLVDTNLKRTKKIDKEIYKIDPDIFQKIEAKTLSFAEWINKNLPSVIKQDVASEIDEETKKKLFYFNYKLKRYFQVETAFFYAIYVPPFSNYIKNNFGGEISLIFFIPKATFLYAGLSSSMYVLDSKSNTTGFSNILMFYIPIFCKFGTNFHLVKYLEVDIAMGNGISVLAGFLIDRTATTVRSNILFDLNIYFTPVKFFKIGGGVSLVNTFGAYNNWSLFSIAPRFTIAASF